MMGEHGGKPKKAKKEKASGGCAGIGVLIGGLGLVLLGVAIAYLISR